MESKQSKKPVASWQKSVGTLSSSKSSLGVLIKKKQTTVSLGVVVKNKLTGAPSTCGTGLVSNSNSILASTGLVANSSSTTSSIGSAAKSKSTTNNDNVLQQREPAIKDTDTSGVKETTDKQPHATMVEDKPAVSALALLGNYSDSDSNNSE